MAEERDNIENNVDDQSFNDQDSVTEKDIDEILDNSEGQEEGQQVYAPSYKYKVLGKEYEFDDELKSLNFNEKIEGKIRDLHERAGAFDHYKTKYSDIEQKYNDVNKEIQEAKKIAEELNFLREHDPEEYCKRIGIDPYKIAHSQLEEEELPEEQREILRENRGYKKQIAQLNKRLEGLEGTVSKTKQETEFEKLQRAVYGRSEVKQLIDSGITDFVDQVVERTRLKNRLKQPISYDQAVGDVINRYAHLLGQPKTQETNKPIAPKSTIPQSGNSRGTVSNVPHFKSLDEFRKYVEKL